MAGLKIHPDNPDVRARVEAFFRGQAEQRFASQATASAGVIEWVTKNPWSWPIAVMGLGGLLAACTRLANSGVIPAYDVSHTPSPTHTPTPSHTPTEAPTLTPTPPPIATELLLAPPTARTEKPSSTPFLDADGDGFPDFPNPDLNGDGRIDAREMAAGVVAVTQWFNIAAQTFAEGKGAPLVVEEIAHFFGHSATTLRAEGAIDLQWVPDSALDLNDPTVANDLGAHDGVGIVTTGAHLSETMSRLAVQVAEAGKQLHNPDSDVKGVSLLLQGLTDGLRLENLWRPGLPSQAADELGKAGNLCAAMDAGDGHAQRAPVVVEAGIKVGQEFRDPAGDWHASPESPMVVVARLVRQDDLRDLQRSWHANGEHVEVTQVTPEHSIAMQVYLGGKDPLDGAQVVPCGRPAQVGAQPTVSVTPTPSATPTETPRPHDGGGPGPEQPTNTPVGPTEAPPPTATSAPFPSSTPFTRPTSTEAPPPPTNTGVPPTAESTEVPVTIIPPEKTLPFDTSIPPTVQTSPTPLR